MLPPTPLYYGKDITKLGPELQQYHAVAYEIDMLSAVLRVAKPLPPGTTADALTESFVMHFRTLASFLWDERTKGTRNTDALAVDFVKGGQWVPREPRPKNFIERVSREVAHLTTFRLSGPHPDKEWTPRDCVAALLPSLEQFAAEVDPQKASPQLKSAVEALRTFHDDKRPAVAVLLDTARSTTVHSTTQVIGR